MNVDQPDLRIGDAERDDATRLLQEHLAAGRLDHAEFESRMARALEATHTSQLGALFEDLPGRRPGQTLPVPMATRPPARPGPPLWMWPAAAAAAVWIAGMGLLSRMGDAMEGPGDHGHMHPQAMTGAAEQGHLGLVVPVTLLVLFAVAIILSVVHGRRVRRRRRRA